MRKTSVTDLTILELNETSNKKMPDYSKELN